ncbi:uncharacterized protein [Primulina eburnea]|uniref:uncharacterized protein n=1 Tax=Primulina eburnea TaxID=1245227 RepID=UPI003C6C57BD
MEPFNKQFFKWKRKTKQEFCQRCNFLFRSLGQKIRLELYSFHTNWKFRMVSVRLEQEEEEGEEHDLNEDEEDESDGQDGEDEEEHQNPNLNLQGDPDLNLQGDPENYNRGLNLNDDEEDESEGQNGEDEEEHQEREHVQEHEQERGQEHEQEHGQARGKIWIERKRRKVIGRVNASNHVEDLLHFQGSFAVLRITQCDRSNFECLNEATTFQMPYELRRLFATILTYCEPANVQNLWDSFYKHLSENFTRHETNDDLDVLFETLNSVDFFL